MRKAGLNIMMSLKGDGKPVSFIEDCAVPLEHLAEYVDRLTQVFARHGTRGTWYAHASVGTLHVRPILDMRRDGAAKMRAIAEEASAMVREYKGAFSGEHGDGLVRSEWVGWQFGPRLSRAFEEIKDLFDPAGPDEPRQDRARDEDGRCVAVPLSSRPSHAAGRDGARLVGVERAERRGHRRADARPEPAAIRPAGFGKAVEMCNNNGHCRKFDAGTMCPSYRATRDEEHLTRGRANTLRLALSGRFGPDALASEPVRAALDLCVSCKGCRRECPTGVDMAKMKIEALHQRQRVHGLPLRDRLIAHLPRWAPWAARMPWLANLRDTLPGAAKLSEAWLGFSAQALAPRVAARHVPPRRGARRATMRRRRTRTSCSSSTRSPTISSPRMRSAALNVLRAAGYRVHVARAVAADAEPVRAAVLRPDVSRRGPRRRGEGRSASRRRRAACRTSSAAPRSSASSRRACCRCGTSSW